MSRIKRAMGLAQDFPRLVNGGLLAVVVLYWLSTVLWWPAASVARSLDAATDSDHLMTLHLGVAALAAMVAGFSGVVVVFGLSGRLSASGVCALPEATACTPTGSPSWARRSREPSWRWSALA